MIYYEYSFIQIDPFHIDADGLQSTLNEMGMEGYRFVGIHKLWTTDKTGSLVQAEYMMLEKAEQEETDE